MLMLEMQVQTHYTLYSLTKAKYFFHSPLQCHSPRFPSGVVEEFSSHAGADVGRKRLPGHWLFAREGKIVANSFFEFVKVKMKDYLWPKWCLIQTCTACMIQG